MLSLFSDMGHELVTSALPLFLASFGGGAAALGIIEGFSDAASSLIKLWMSYFSDRIGKRKPIIVFGYLATALMGCFAFITAWWQILVLRVLAWMGRGARGPVRDALLSESVPPEALGKAFGFQRMLDTVGAILGPLIALSLIGVVTTRHLFLIAFIPGGITVLIAVFLLKDRPRLPQTSLRLWSSLASLPRPFWRYVAAVGLFGLGNFAHTLLILRAVTLLTPSYGGVRAGQLAIGLYILHNVLYAAVSYPAGVLADRMDKKILLSVGYGLFGLMCVGFLVVGQSVIGLVAVFVCAGLYIGIVDAVEKATAADLLPENCRGTGFGALAAVNSVGDLISSSAVGLLWSRFSIAAGFSYAAFFALAAALALLTLPKQSPRRLSAPSA